MEVWNMSTTKVCFGRFLVQLKIFLNHCILSTARFTEITFTCTQLSYLNKPNTFLTVPKPGNVQYQLSEQKEEELSVPGLLPTVTVYSPIRR